MLCDPTDEIRCGGPKVGVVFNIEPRRWPANKLKMESCPVLLGRPSPVRLRLDTDDSLHSPVLRRWPAIFDAGSCKSPTNVEGPHKTVLWLFGNTAR